jgi:hypothetical protein
MKTLVKILRTENGIVHYQEISRKDGSVMIEDSNTAEGFYKALTMSKGFGFELVIYTKAQALKVLKSLGLSVRNWEYCGIAGCQSFSLVLHVKPFNFNGHVHNVVHVARHTRELLIIACLGLSLECEAV